MSDRGSSVQAGPGGVLERILRRLSRAVRRRPHELEIESTLLEDGEDPWEDLRRELNRSRRYERRFVVIRIDYVANGRGLQEGDLSVRRARELSAFLRNVDRVWTAEETVYLLLPESDRSMGEAFIARVRRDAPELLPEDRVGLAVFPDDGWTSGALLAALEGRPLVAPQAGPRLEPEESAGSVVDLRVTRADERA
jgi:hypothetical protein